MVGTNLNRWEEKRGREDWVSERLEQSLDLFISLNETAFAALAPMA